ncbi:putative kinase-like protein TMKL1 isoform X2 [Phragmites australis]|uniref:putative kinase-like protein TMKL1 isoform X2 n=1 Tax=Phragmites australis TaxID=29695 RepID=UPI002D7A2F32|nr:putative kinase-like protein TMKL1 isoform X2 [Phragmites australis]
MEMAGAAEAATPGQEPMRKGRSNSILLPIVGILFAYLLYRYLRPRLRGLRLDRLPFRLPACLRRRTPSGSTVLPYFAPIADRLGALPYLGPIAERLGVGPQGGGFGGYHGGADALVKFPGGEALSVAAILEAPGEVVAKSAHSTLYRATMRSGEAAVLLRFVRPACAVGAEEASAAARRIGAVSHPNLVPLRAVYVGPRGEKLLVHPFYAAGSLHRFMQGIAESQRWNIICKLSLGIVKGLDHLHTDLEKPIVHGNLKTSNILLDANYECKISDYGLYLLLNPNAAQEMLDTSAAQGYKAPELMKMRDATRENDIYSLGVVLLEMLAQKLSTDDSRPNPRDILLPVSFKNLVLERKISDAFSSDLVKQCKKSGKEKNLNAFFELATACCSPSPSLRPNTKYILKRLEEIAR